LNPSAGAMARRDGVRRENGASGGCRGKMWRSDGIFRRCRAGGESPACRGKLARYADCDGQNRWRGRLRPAAVE
jgi:hypothetical protein